MPTITAHEAFSPEGVRPGAQAPARPASAGQARPRLVRRALHGVLMLDKPLAFSSFDAVKKVKNLLRAEKAGHTGTLDPLASGLLPVCLGAATKFSQLGLEADKRYTATVQFGVTTRTGDREGEVLSRQQVSLSRAQLLDACQRFLGTIQQRPPMHSALKHEGKSLYEWARAGVEVEREARDVQIHGIDVLGGEADTWLLDVRCSKGTYIRTLAEDLGQALDCGAHLAGLRRTGSGHLSLESCIDVSALESLDEPAREAALFSPDILLGEVPRLLLAPEAAGRFLSGVRLRSQALADSPPAERVAVYGPAASRHAAVFLGSAHVQSGELICQRLLSPPEVQGLIHQGLTCSEQDLVKW
jgi:tRNA pseudouridine55 synthase